MSARLRALGREAVEITERGGYRNVVIDAGPSIAATRLYLPDDPLPAESTPGKGRPAKSLPAESAPGRIEVTDESTLAAARRLGGSVAALVFASARNPGGGFLNGAQAQEESIARSSALYPCLRAAGDFYAYHRAHSELTYSDRVIYSPAVPVFRDDRGELLTEPYPVSFLTSAAPNLSAIRSNQPELAAEVPAVLRRRAKRVLAVATAHGHRRIVLGAWGCGVFGNDPATVAEAFTAALREFPMEHVVFAILGPNRAAFTAGAGR